MTPVDWFFVIIALVGHAGMTSKFIGLEMKHHEERISAAHDHATNAHRRADDAHGMAVEAHIVSQRAEAKIDTHLKANGQ